MKTSGFKEHRLNKDDNYYAKEIKALELFNRDYLKEADSIVFGQKDNSFMQSNDTLSEREERIVLGLIQWLGTPGGQGFINQLNED